MCAVVSPQWCAFVCAQISAKLKFDVESSLGKAYFEFGNNTATGPEPLRIQAVFFTVSDVWHRGGVCVMP